MSGRRRRCAEMDLGALASQRGSFAAQGFRGRVIHAKYIGAAASQQCAGCKTARAEADYQNIFVFEWNHHSIADLRFHELNTCPHRIFNVLSATTAHSIERM